MTDEVKDETASFVVSVDDSQAAPLMEVEAKETDQGDAQVDDSKEQQAEVESAASEDEADNSGEKTTAEDNKIDEQEAGQPKAKQSKGVQKRIDKVVKEREEAKRRAEAAEKRLKELEGSNHNDKQSKEPVESDYDSYDSYLDALDEFESSQQEETQVKPVQEEAQEEAQEDGDMSDAQRTAMAVIKEKFEDAEAPDDFEEVALNPEVPVTGDMLEALAECDDPTKVLYHLGQNIDLATEIAGKSAAQQMREIAKLDLTVEVKPPKPVKVTKAADPIEPVGGSDAQQKHISEMSFSEYEAYMNKKEQSGFGQ